MLWQAVVVWGLFLASSAHASVFVFMGDNTSSFVVEDADAAFGGAIPPKGMQGILRQAIPYDGCSAFDSVIDPLSTLPQFALIVRGNCQFDVKVLNAQLAGFSAAIIYDNEESKDLITMSGRHSWDVYIPAVFVTMDSGRKLLASIEQGEDAVCFLTPAFDNTAWSIMTASFLSLLAVCSVLTLFTYIRRARFQELAHRMLEREPLGMPASQVKALPEIAFREGSPESSGLETCAICLDDYEDEEVLRLLPCKHGFHAACIDQWLTTRSPCCPVCKRDCKAQGQNASTSTSSSSSALSNEERHLRFLRWLEVPVPQRFPALSFLFGSLQPLQEPLLPVTSSASEDAEEVSTLEVEAEHLDNEEEEVSVEEAPLSSREGLPV